MKKAILTILIGASTICSSLAGPSWGFTLGNGAGFYYGNNRPNNNNCHEPRTMPGYVVHSRPTVLEFGPQYYRVRGVPSNARVVNYSDAPIIIETFNCRTNRNRSYVVPRSWD